MATEIFVVDASGSVSDKELAAGRAFVMAATSGRRGAECVIAQWNGDRKSLAQFVEKLRLLDKVCMITLITDGLITDEEADLVDAIYIYAADSSVNTAAAVFSNFAGSISV